MGFTSLIFLGFFPIVFIIYLLIPSGGRALWLLAASYLFCMSFGVKYALVLLISTLGTWAAGLALERLKNHSSRKWLLAAAILLHVFLLCFFKYDSRNPVLPVGISFYTFQAIGYLADILQGRAKAERNIIYFGLFQAFFPKLVQGPIERSHDLLEQIRSLPSVNLPDPDRIREGGLLLLWGLFQKLMIADRLAIPVNAVYRQFGAFGGVEILLATVLYAFQIYCDFAGYTSMARGIARICGIELTENFRRPYLLKQLASGLRLYPSGRKPERTPAKICKCDAYLCGQRHLARNRLSLPFVGLYARSGPAFGDGLSEASQVASADWRSLLSDCLLDGISRQFSGRFEGNAENPDNGSVP